MLHGTLSQEEATERAFTSPLNDEKRDGVTGQEQVKRSLCCAEHVLVERLGIGHGKEQAQGRCGKDAESDLDAAEQEYPVHRPDHGESNQPAAQGNAAQEGADRTKPWAGHVGGDAFAAGGQGARVSGLLPDGIGAPIQMDRGLFLFHRPSAWEAPRPVDDLGARAVEADSIVPTLGQRHTIRAPIFATAKMHRHAAVAVAVAGN